MDKELKPGDLLKILHPAFFVLFNKRGLEDEEYYYENFYTKNIILQPNIFCIFIRKYIRIWDDRPCISLIHKDKLFLHIGLSRAGYFADHFEIINK